MTVPAPFTVTTNKLFGCTMGSPYNTHAMQFTRVARYGVAEYCSTAFLFHIWTKVGLQIIKTHKINSFPLIQFLDVRLNMGCFCFLDHCIIYISFLISSYSISFIYSTCVCSFFYIYLSKWNNHFPKSLHRR